jgi:ADP-heptose:LPS heptosyltransferase
MAKPTWLIYINNTIAYFIFNFLKLFFGKRNLQGKNILFINTGQIGDLIISSVVMNNFTLLKYYENIYFLIKEQYSELYNDYDGRAIILKWNYEKYKYNFFYRVAFLKKLHSLNLKLTFNITSARGVTNDELALLSGAEKVICLNSNWRYLKKLFGKKMDSNYDEILTFNTINEFEKNKKLTEYITNSDIAAGTKVYLKDNTFKTAKEKFKNYFQYSLPESYIVISPLSGSSLNKHYEHYNKLCSLIVSNLDYKILITGTDKQQKQLEEIKTIAPERIINTAGIFSILENAAIVKNSSLFIGNDSGFTHIAKSFGIKLIGIVGGGSYGLFFPYAASANERLMFSKMDCFGCEWKCIYDKPYCHYNVSPENVFNEVKNLLSIK